ncbi:hypothetical protein [Robertkochia flava]|uniref:hypothetical protein n=1 Tax=Robertkochia flava TaxID=3447986 RepID=UPI001CCAFC18|nr:hypothetical protein [Robertkochia marina]
MKLQYFVVFLIITFISNALYAQADIVSPEDIKGNERSLIARAILPVRSADELAPTKQNAVYIQQIGQSNKVFTYAQTSKGSISVLQEGNNNKAGLFLKAETIEYNLTQSGNDNKYLHFNISNPDLIKVNAVQQGNDTDIIIHGKNSISEKMKINMIGNDRALIIRNFN